MNALTTYDCKVPGCTEPAKLNRGPNAYLCATHIADRPGAKRPKSATSENGYLGKVQALTAAAKRLDRAHLKNLQARAELEQAKGDWNRAVDELDLGFEEKELGRV